MIEMPPKEYWPQLYKELTDRIDEVTAIEIEQKLKTDNENPQDINPETQPTNGNIATKKTGYYQCRKK